MDRDHVAAWLAAYEQAWRSPGTAALAGLFSPDATYQQAPYDEQAHRVARDRGHVGGRAGRAG